MIGEAFSPVLCHASDQCCIFAFFRIFRPPASDDESHDEALSSRIAALNMLDLSLAHLGVDVNAESEAQLNEVVADCGKGNHYIISTFLMGS